MQNNSALLKRAVVCGCTPLELLLMRLTEMHRRIIGALGEISYAQFYDPEPTGFMLMRISARGFDLTVEFHPAASPTATYQEELISLDDLQRRKERLLAAILSSTPAQAKERAEARFIEQLRTGELHWDGRRKADLGLEILSQEGVSCRALSFSELDPELARIPFADGLLPIQQLASDLLYPPQHSRPSSRFLDHFCRPKPSPRSAGCSFRIESR
jgi:hypothetical protein